MSIPASVPYPFSGQAYDYPTYRIEVDWNSDGDWSDGNEDVTPDVKALAGVAVQYGRDSSQPLGPTASGTAGMELDNVSQKYTPANTASTLFGLLLPGRPVRMRATIGAETYSLFSGHTDDSPIDPDASAQSVQISMLDALAKLRGQTVSTSLYQGIRTGAAIGHVLDAVGWPAGARDIDVGATVMPYWWAAGQDAYEALVALIHSEGPPALLSVGPAGEVVFRDRHHRLTRAASMDVQEYWRGKDLADGSKVNLSWADVINHVEFEVPERFPDPELSQVWQTEDIITITDGETKIIKAMGSEPFTHAVVPVAGTDFELVSGAVSVTLSRTSGQVTEIRILATGGPAVLNGLALRAYAIPVVRTRVVEAQDTTSSGSYGRRSWPSPSAFAGRHDAAAQAAIILTNRATPRAALTARFVSVNATEMARQIARDLSDRIEITDEVTLAGKWHIDSIKHKFDGRVGHETTLTCEQVLAPIADVFILGSPANGVVGTNKLGRTALDEPRNVFIVGSSTNGVLGTNLTGY